ncbi:MAG: hypothetical protein H0V17_27370 [Deltaproteobacteria bacterium]|nr:hypothetical protein [Deltaproteobacteria bacterium]
MKFKALIIALVASTSSAALASHPEYEGAGEVPQDESIHDRRARWIPINSMVHATATAHGRTQIRVPDARSNLRAIKVESGSGAVYVYTIRLRYADGHRETIAVNKWLYAGAPTMAFDLAPDHQLARISVETWTRSPSTFRVLGQRSRHIRPPVFEQPPLPPAPPAPVAFVAGRDLTFSNPSGALQLAIGADKGRFSKLRIESTSSTFIGHVHVTFASGARQMINIDKLMNRGDILDFDLDGTLEPIASLTVMQNHSGLAQGAGRFSVSLLGSR